MEIMFAFSNFDGFCFFEVKAVYDLPRTVPQDVQNMPRFLSNIEIVVIVALILFWSKNRADNLSARFVFRQCAAAFSCLKFFIILMAEILLMDLVVF